MKARMMTTLLLVAVIATGGCTKSYVAVGDENMKVSYDFGTLKVVLAKDVDTLSVASLAAMEELKLPVTNKNRDKLVGRVEGYTSDGQTVKVKMEALSEGVTMLSIRVGTLGDEALSRMILVKIMKNLK
jgi:hypothetical protein